MPLDGGTFDYENCFVWNTLFDSNEADRGGGLFIRHSNIEVFNCVMTDNSAARGGAAYYNEVQNGWTVRFNNCTAAYNEVTDGAELADGAAFFFLLTEATTSTVSVKNSIVWSNVKVTNGLSEASSINAFENQGPPNGEVDVTSKVLVRYSDVEKGHLQWPPPVNPWPGEGNILSDPQFTNGTARIMTLQSISPCIDAANNAHILKDWTDLDEDGSAGPPGGEDTPYDFSGSTARRLDGPPQDTGSGTAPIVDMGAFEFE